MSSFIDPIITYLTELATKIPLELFALVGSFLEELIAPIPSPLIMTMAGSVAQAQQKALLYLLIIAMLSSFAKTLAGIVLYIISDKAEDLILIKFGKFFGISHKEVERIGRHFSGGFKSDAMLFLLRSIPVMPSSPISITCGVLKINFKSFVIATFLGSIIRSFFFLYLGFTGLAASQDVLSGIDSMETIGKLVFLALLGGLLLWGYKKRSENKI